MSAKDSSTKDKLLKVAQELFLSHGFSATSVEAICRKARITKGGFFHHFASKEELGKAVLNRFCESSQRFTEESAARYKNVDPLERLLANFDSVSRYVQNESNYKGCLLATFTQEMSDSNPDIRALCAQGLKQWAQMIKADLKLVKKKYAAAARLDIDSLADYCVSVIEGAQVLAKAMQDPSVIEKNIGHLKRYIRFVFQQTKQ